MGDPGLEVWTGVPREMIANYDSQVSTGSDYLEISVSEVDGTPIEGAWIC